MARTRGPEARARHDAPTWLPGGLAAGPPRPVGGSESRVFNDGNGARHSLAMAPGPKVATGSVPGLELRCRPQTRLQHTGAAARRSAGNARISESFSLSFRLGVLYFPKT